MGFAADGQVIRVAEMGESGVRWLSVSSAEEGGADHGTLFLADIRSIFTEVSLTPPAWADSADRRGRMEDRPWAEWRHGQPITSLALRVHWPPSA